jgi:predicted ATP-grasp superfamily ATP-dependent carboligase
MQRVLDAVYRHVGHDCVLFATSDTAILTLARLYSALNHHLTVIPDQETVERMVIKSKFYRSLQNSGIPYPETFFSEETSFTELVRSVTFPVYVRPAQIQIFSQYFRGKGFVARTPRELQYYLQLAQKNNVEVMVQEIVPGPTQNGYIVRGYISRQGVLKVLIALQKLWQPIMFDNESIEVTIPRSQIVDYFKPFLKWIKRFHYRGIFDAEFKRDDRDGAMKLLEVNARSTGDSYMGRACGADEIFAAYSDALGNDISSTDKYQHGVYYIREISSLKTILNRITQAQPSHLGDLGRMLSKKHFHLFSRDDLLPVFVELRQGAANLINRVLKPGR